MRLPKYLEDKKEELSEKVEIPFFAKSFSERAGHIASWKDGFDAAYALTSEREKMLVDELTEIKVRAFANSQEPQAGRYLLESPEYWRGYQAASCAIENFVTETLAKLKETE